MTAVVFLAGLGAAVLLMLGVGRAYWRRRVGTWARQNGLTLLELEGAFRAEVAPLSHETEIRAAQAR